jgi:crossover junction endodeoxyribonuclease RuvC
MFMTILGIDPGTAITGFAFIQRTSRQEFLILQYGVIRTAQSLSDSERLNILAADLKSLITQHKPDKAGVEKLFFTTNQKTAITVAQARGVILATLAQTNIPIYECTPLQVKSSICGYGKATKRQVQTMVQKHFRLSTLPKPDDAADALAIALCAANKP